jgi:amino acid transporter
MGRYNPSLNSGSSLNKPQKEVHPIWRGIGLVFIFLIPFLSYGIAGYILQLNNKNGWVAIPKDWLLPKFTDHLILVKLGVTIFLILIFFAIFTFITFVINSAFGPSRYGPMDVPNQSTWGKKMKRR